ncbi:hypothetical protein FF38_09026 [Lucilia cuprina]|uniref:Transmembrane protein n=1 Tax=Lucilia cuprina TaxID=7375 RepID=A0A0L0BLP5_LUCCU|nr:hypothetical protein FF38_09026 [Lucilia cuprina]
MTRAQNQLDFFFRNGSGNSIIPNHWLVVLVYNLLPKALLLLLSSLLTLSSSSSSSTTFLLLFFGHSTMCERRSSLEFCFVFICMNMNLYEKTSGIIPNHWLVVLVYNLLPKALLLLLSSLLTLSSSSSSSTTFLLLFFGHSTMCERRSSLEFCFVFICMNMNLYEKTSEIHDRSMKDH